MRNIIFSILVLGSVAACSDEMLTPIVESDRQYTLFGTLDMARDSQFVRVIPIRETLIEPGDLLNVSVRSIESSTNRTLQWQDSIHTFADGRIGHIFYAPLRILPSRTYRIEVTPAGQELITSAETTIPSPPEPVVMDAVLDYIFTTQLSAKQQILWRGLDKAPFEIEQWYRFLSLADFTFKDYKLSYDPLQQLMDGESQVWEMTKDLVRDRDSLSSKLDLDTYFQLAGLAIRITLLDQNFVPPGGNFDRDLLAQPGTLSNVENGFGLLGSVGRFSVEWILPDQITQELGYLSVQRTVTSEEIWKDPPGTYEVAEE